MNFSEHSINFSILPYEEGVKPPVIKPNPEFLIQAGEEGIRDLFTRFYGSLHISPIKDLFPQSKEEMMTASQHSADFFIQICGGTPYFNQNRGAPQMGRRHAPFAITPEARLHWLVLFEDALQPLVGKVSDENMQSLWNYINVFSIWMINSRA